MQTKSKYEETVLKELREFPGESLPHVIRILRSLREGISAAKSGGKRKKMESGLCGIWKDERSADEIIEDILPHTGLS